MKTTNIFIICAFIYLIIINVAACILYYEKDELELYKEYYKVTEKYLDDIYLTYPTGGEMDTSNIYCKKYLLIRDKIQR